MANLVEAKLDDKKIGTIKAADLTRRQLVKLLDGIVDRGAPAMAIASTLLQSSSLSGRPLKISFPLSPWPGSSVRG